MKKPIGDLASATGHIATSHGVVVPSELLKSLDALEAKATSGVWENSAGFVRSRLPQEWPVGGTAGDGMMGMMVRTSCTWVAETVHGEGYIPGNGNADFIAALRNAYPQLRDEINKLERTAARARELLVRLKKINVIFPSMCANNSDAHQFLRDLDEFLEESK